MEGERISLIYVNKAFSIIVLFIECFEHNASTLLDVRLCDRWANAKRVCWFYRKDEEEKKGWKEKGSH